MRAIVIENPGVQVNLAWREVEDPIPGHGEILVRVAAAGVNRADLMQSAGRYPPTVGARPCLARIRRRVASSTIPRGHAPPEHLSRAGLDTALA